MKEELSQYKRANFPKSTMINLPAINLLPLATGEFEKGHAIANPEVCRFFSGDTYKSQQYQLIDSLKEKLDHLLLSEDKEQFATGLSQYLKWYKANTAHIAYGESLLPNLDSILKKLAKYGIVFPDNNEPDDLTVGMSNTKK